MYHSTQMICAEMQMSPAEAPGIAAVLSVGSQHLRSSDRHVFDRIATTLLAEADIAGPDIILQLDMSLKEASKVAEVIEAADDIVVEDLKRFGEKLSFMSGRWPGGHAIEMAAA